MFSPQQIDQFKEICSSFGVNLSDEMISQFQKYTNLLLDWNNRIHLVSKGDTRTDRIIRHFVDSLTIFKAIDIPRGANILDLGSGAGFPAIPIRIIRNDVKMTLVESTHKKALFLQKGINLLKLDGINIVDARSEDLVNQSDYSERFDFLTAKALGRLKDMAQLGLGFLKSGGLLVAYKGYQVDDEIKELGSLSAYRFKGTTEVQIKSFDLKRKLVLIEKVGFNKEK
jgi:16S rRNA (guanine527-N7)-methyltransferase